MKEVNVISEEKGAPTEESPGTRRRIMQAATHLFAEKGFHGVSVKDISAAAETNSALIFYYFKSKRELYDSLYRDAQEEMIAAVEKSLEGKSDAIARLEELIRFSLKKRRKNSDFDLLLSREIHGFGEYSREQLFEMFNSVISLLEKFVSQGVREGVFRKLNPRLSAVLILGNLHIFSNHYYDPESKISTGETYRQVREMILNGLMKPSE